MTSRTSKRIESYAKLLESSTAFERLDLFLSATNLPQLYTRNITDPFAVVSCLDGKHDSLIDVGITEVVLDNYSPQWTSPVTIDYLFEEIQEIFIRVYHCTDVNNLRDIEKHELIGEARFLLSTIMRAPSQKMSLLLENSRRTAVRLGEIEIRAEARANTRDMFTAEISASKLINKEGFFGRSDPFLLISRKNEDTSYTNVWKSAVQDSSLNPKWGRISIPMVILCNGDIDRELKIEIYDFENNSKHHFMGAVETTLRTILQGNTTTSISSTPMINETSVIAIFPVIEEVEHQRNPSKYMNSGLLTISDARIEHHPTLSDFIFGGCDISLIVGIDFTGSNGHPQEGTSLHYIHLTDPTHWNVYQQAIYAVGNVLEPYDSDHLYSVFGFGARVKLPNNGGLSSVQHCFPIYGGSNQVAGVQGILQAYRDALEHIELAGPTQLAPIITATAQLAAFEGCTQEHQRYYILLLITDGVVNDMEATKLAIIQASRLPMSIIIVGVGPADFDNMYILDSDRQLLHVNKQIAERDIVQFVPFRTGIGSAALAQQVLAEVPRQLLDYMAQRNIRPNQRRGY
jgi:copine 5/8/9